MPDRTFCDILDDGSLRPVGRDAAAALGARAGRYWLHDSHPEVVFLTYAGLDPLGSSPPTERAIFCADLDALPAIEVFGMIAQSRLTQRVVAVRDGIERVLLFKTGELASIASNDARDRIGNFLVRMGLVQRDQLEQVLSAAPASGRRAGQLLIDSGLISSHDLWRAISQQVTELFCEVSTWSSGHIIAYALSENFVFPSTPTQGTQGLLMEAVRRADEMALIREKIPDDSVCVVATGRGKVQGVEAQRLVSKAAEPRSISELSRLLKRSQFDVLRLIFSVMQAGALEVSEAVEDGIDIEFDDDRLADLLQVFEMAMREVLEEVDKVGAMARFLDAINAYLADDKTPQAPLYRGLALDANGALDEPTLSANASAVEGDSYQAISEALNELLFFALFQCGELLDKAVDEDLARRVRMIYATLND